MSGNKSKLIAFNYFGGKFTFLESLYSYFPNDLHHLIDLFAGSMAVSLNYRNKRIIKTANEINSDITNFFEVLRDHETELVRLLLLTPCSMSEYGKCYGYSEDNIENARRFYIRVRQSFFGLGSQRRNKGWHMAKSQLNASRGETVSKWNNAIPKLYEVAEVIRSNFQITNYHYTDCIRNIDFKGAFFYCDPPYPKETRVVFNDYKFEFSTEDHIELSEKLHNIKGRAMVSSYESDLYNDLYKDWQKIYLPVKKNNIRASKVQEIIWINYDTPQKQLKLF